MLVRFSRQGDSGMVDAEHAPPPAPLAGLFADGGSGRALSVALPAGRLVWPDPRRRPGGIAAARPAYWLSDGPATAALWTRLRAEHGQSGLWPLLLEGLDHDPGRPWVVGEVVPEPVSDVDGQDAAGFFAARWAEWVTNPSYDWLAEDVEFLSPFGRDWPGLAVPGELTQDPEVAADRVAEQVAGGSSRLGLVAVQRGADALVVSGWRGACNHIDRMAPLSAVLRSWEDRFAARVVRIGFDTLLVSVAAPPVTFEHALHVAAEHWMFCPDNVHGGEGRLAACADQLRGESWWKFWWD